jgi:hypothetical protein
VCDEEQSRLGSETLLFGGANADPVPGEHTGDGVEDAGLVDDLEAEEVLGCQLVDRADA